jgi:hypothetical protein
MIVAMMTDAHISTFPGQMFISPPTIYTNQSKQTDSAQTPTKLNDNKSFV